jgi:hypothetical protein
MLKTTFDHSKKALRQVLKHPSVSAHNFVAVNTINLDESRDMSFL